MKITKAKLAEVIQRRLGTVSKREATRLVDAFFLVLVESLSRGESIKLKGFGVFEVRSKSSRPVRNPRTMQPVMLEPRQVVVFRPSASLKTLLNPTRAASAAK